MSQTFFIKELTLNYNNSDNKERYIFDIILNENNKYSLIKTQDNRFKFIKNINGIINEIQSSQQQFRQWQIFNILICIDEKYGTKISILKNGDSVETISNKDISILHGNINMYLHKSDNTSQINGYISAIYYKSSSYYIFDDLIKQILNNKYEEFFSNENLITNLESSSQEIEVFPNNYYEINGNKQLIIEEYNNSIKIKNYNNLNGNIIINVAPYTNKIKIISNDNLQNVNCKLKMQVNKIKIGTRKIGTNKVGIQV